MEMSINHLGMNEWFNSYAKDLWYKSLIAETHRAKWIGNAKFRSQIAKNVLLFDMVWGFLNGISHLLGRELIFSVTFPITDRPRKKPPCRFAAYRAKQKPLLLYLFIEHF